MKVNNSKNYINILNKIAHKPIIMDNIFLFIEKKSYILIELILNDRVLKKNLTKFFNKIKSDNNLSKELNSNIKKFIIYRKIKEKKLKDLNNYDIFKELKILIYNDIKKTDLLNYNKILNKDEKALKAEELYKYIVNEEIRNNEVTNNLIKNFFEMFIYNDKRFYRVEHYKKIENILNCLNYSERGYKNYRKYYFINYLKYLKLNNEFILYMEILFYFFYNNFQFIKSNIFHNIYEILNMNINNSLENFFAKKNYSYIKELIIKNIIIYKINDIASIENYFYLFSLLDNFTIYHKTNNIISDNNSVDKKYLDYLEKNKIKQKIKLICIIDSNSYSKYLFDITYKYINEVHFKINISNLHDIYNNHHNKIDNIIVKYLKTLKNPEKINIISFDNSFYYVKNIHDDKPLINHLTKNNNILQNFIKEFIFDNKKGLFYKKNNDLI